MTCKNPPRDPSRRARIPLSEVFLFLCIVVGPSVPLSAQVVTGRVREAGTGQSIAGALVRIVGQEREPNETISAAEGRFRLVAASSAPFTLQIDMIGRHSWTSKEYLLEPSDTLYVDVELEVEAIALADLVARPERRCTGVGSEAAVQLQSLWRNVTTALETARVTRVRQPLAFNYELYQRDVTHDSLVVVKDQRQRHVGSAPAVFGSASIVQLDSLGFYQPTDQGGTLLGPSAEVLLNRWFLDTHCIRLSRQRGRTRSIGVAFVPTRDRRMTEIEGIIWLDSATYDLREIDFRFVNVPTRTLPDSYSGNVRFERLSSGALVLSEWVMRSPMIQMIRRSAGRLAGTHEVGGSLLRAELDGIVLFASSRGSVVGTVYQSDGQPLAGADVFLRGTGFETVSDSTGRYNIIGLPAGTYVIGFEHPSLDDPDAAQAAQHVTVVPDVPVRLDLHDRSR